MFEVQAYIDKETGEQKMDILIHREDDGCFFVELHDVNGNPVDHLRGGKIEMFIYDRERNYHPLIVIPMDNDTREIVLSHKETRQFYYDRDYYYSLVFTSVNGSRYTFCSGDIQLIELERGGDYGCCQDQVIGTCGFEGRNQ